MLIPVQNISWVAIKALLPLMSRLQKNPPAIAAMYLKAVQGVTLLAAPLMMCLFLTRHDLIPAVMGEQWTNSGELLKWLAPVGCLQAIIGASSPALMAMGQGHTLLKLGLYNLLLHSVAFVTGALTHGLEGLAMGYLCANLIVSVLTWTVTHKQLNLSHRQVFHQMLPGILLSLTIALFIDQSDQWAWSQLSLMSPLFRTLLIAGVLYTTTLVFFYRHELRRKLSS